MGTVAIVKCLVEAGAILNAALESGATAIAVAAWEGTDQHVEVLRYLAEAGADLDKAQIDGTFPLALAILRGHLNIVRYVAVILLCCILLFMCVKNKECLSSMG